MASIVTFAQHFHFTTSTVHSAYLTDFVFSVKIVSKQCDCTLRLVFGDVLLSNRPSKNYFNNQSVLFKNADAKLFSITKIVDSLV